MPEGDTLRRAAALVAPVLEGQELSEAWFGKLRGHRPRAGDTVESVDATGKYLLITFDRPLVLHTHLGMAGYWRVLPPDIEPRPNPKLRVKLATVAGTALCYAAPRIETHVVGAGTSPVEALGPDLSEDDADIDEVLRRSRRVPQNVTLAELLLDQRVAAGVGNVFKSEALFSARLHPFATVGSIDDEQLRDLWTIAHRQLVANRSRRFRSTTATATPGNTHVYGRRRGGCRRCDNAIVYSAAGERTARSTYWCPTCQPTDGTRAGSPASWRVPDDSG